MQTSVLTRQVRERERKTKKQRNRTGCEQLKGFNSSLQMAMWSISSLTLVGLYQEMIVVLGLQLKVATIILGCIFSMLLSDFKYTYTFKHIFPCRCQDQCPSIVSIMVFYIFFAMMVSVFLYAYYIYVMIYLFYLIFSWPILFNILTLCHLEDKSKKQVSILSLSLNLKCQKILQNCMLFSL